MKATDKRPKVHATAKQILFLKDFIKMRSFYLLIKDGSSNSL